MLLKKLMQGIDFSNLLSVRGVDGFLSLDLDYNIQEVNIPAELNQSALVNACGKFIDSRKALASLDTDILLTERGVLVLARIEDFYLVIVAGYKESVDVARLSELIEQIKISLGS